MNQELEAELKKMASFYNQGKEQILLKMKTSGSGLDTDLILNSIKSLTDTLESLSTNLTLTVVEYQGDLITELFNKLLAQMEVVNDLLEEKQDQFQVDQLLGILDQLTDVHSLHVEQVESIKELLDSSPRQ